MHFIKKIIVVIMVVMMLLLIVGCTQTQDVKVKVQYYDKDGNLLGEQDISNQVNAQALIQIPNVQNGETQN